MHPTGGLSAVLCFDKDLLQTENVLSVFFLEQEEKEDDPLNEEKN